VAAGIAAAGLSLLAVPARADSYTDYLVARLHADPVYISSYSEIATPADGPAIQRLIGRLPLKTFVVADVGAGQDGELQDSDLASVLHDQLGGGLFIMARQSADETSATGFGTSLPVSDAMTAATEELDVDGSGSLVQVVQRFVTILLSGKTEQRLAADERAINQQLNPSDLPSAGGVAALASGTVAGCAATSVLLISGKRRRRRRGRPRPGHPSGAAT
jgi:hypothetical protein